MPFKIVRNEITKMQCDAIVKYVNEKIGFEEGEAFITTAFDRGAKYIIQAVISNFTDDSLEAENSEADDSGEVNTGVCDLETSDSEVGDFEEENSETSNSEADDFEEESLEISNSEKDHSRKEKKLRTCYQNILKLAYENGVKSIAFPLISTGETGYAKEEGMRIAVDEINDFLITHQIQPQMLIYLVVVDRNENLDGKIYPDLENYIHTKYIDENILGAPATEADMKNCATRGAPAIEADMKSCATKEAHPMEMLAKQCAIRKSPAEEGFSATADFADLVAEEDFLATAEFDFYEQHESKLQERMKHMSDTFSEYLLYLIKDKGKTNAEGYKKAIVDKKVFSKIKNNPDYHPQKMTAMCLCVGAELNLDETKDLLARAGYALSPCDKTDIIFSYFIENKIYDMIELDIQLEEHGLKCLIS